MNTLRLVGILTVLALLEMTVTYAANAISGSATVKEITCDYSEYKPKAGKCPRGLKLYSCQNNQGKKINKSCTYYGANPHIKSCANTYIKHTQKYYKSLAKSAMENGLPCEKATITEDLCGLVYPCIDGDCPGNRGRRAIESDLCESNLLDLPNASSVPYLSVLTGFIGLLNIMFEILY